MSKFIKIFTIEKINDIYFEEKFQNISEDKMDIEYEGNVFKSEKDAKINQISSNIDLEKNFENFILNRDSNFMNFSNPNSINNGNNSDIYERKIQIKLEIIEIIFFLIRTIKSKDNINAEIFKFTIDLFDILVLKRDDIRIIEKIGKLGILIL